MQLGVFSPRKRTSRSPAIPGHCSHKGFPDSRRLRLLKLSATPPVLLTTALPRAANEREIGFGATTLFTNVTFTIAKGERWGLIGRNGSGKTTLFNLFAGLSEPTSGTIARQPGVRLSMMEQDRDFADSRSIWEAAAGGRSDLLELEKSLSDQSTRIGELGEQSTSAMLSKYDRDLERFEREGGYEFAPRVDAVLHGLGFDPDAARIRQISELSGGERGRLGLARQLRYRKR